MGRKVAEAHKNKMAYRLGGSNDVLIKIKNFQESANNWLNVGKSSAPEKRQNFLKGKN